MFDDITGIILAGGKSKRMGENKALMSFNGKTVIEHVVSTVSSLFKRVIIITNTPSDYSNLGLEMFSDFYENKGPLAGIHSGLASSMTEKNFIISCDMPLVTTEIINYICSYKTIKPITILKADGYLQHLCGMYCRKILPYAGEMLMNSSYSPNQKGCNIHDLIDEVGSEVIDASKIPGYFEGMFLNLNCPEDYKRLLSVSKVLQ